MRKYSERLPPRSTWIYLSICSFNCHFYRNFLFILLILGVITCIFLRYGHNEYRCITTDGSCPLTYITCFFPFWLCNDGIYMIWDISLAFLPLFFIGRNHGSLYEIGVVRSSSSGFFSCFIVRYIPCCITEKKCVRMWISHMFQTLIFNLLFPWISTVWILS